MDRRCTSEACISTATGREASLGLSLSQVLVNPAKDWMGLAAGRTRVAREIEVDWKNFGQDRYIFSHCSIVASVSTEENGYHIDPVCSPLVNNNGNAWTNPVLLSTFRSFVGGENYCFAPDTGVMMADRTYKPIQDVQVGDEVVTHTGAVRKVVHKFEREFEGEARAIRFDRFKNPIIATGNHPFRAIEVSAPPLKKRSGTESGNAIRYRQDQIVKELRDGESSFVKNSVVKVIEMLGVECMTSGEIAKKMGWRATSVDSLIRKNACLFKSRKMKDGEKNDLKGKRRRARLWMPSEDGREYVERQKFSAEKTWTRADELSCGDFVLGPEIANGATRDISLARVLGYYLAEGCLLSPSKDIGIVLTFGKHEKDLIRDSIEHAENAFPEASISSREGQTHWRVEVRGRGISKWFAENAGTHADRKRLGRDVFNFDKESLLNMFACWMSGDGSIHKETLRFRGATVSESLARQMQFVAEMCGVKSFVVFEKQRIGEATSSVVLEVGGEPREFDVVHRHHVWTVTTSKNSSKEMAKRSLRWERTPFKATVKREDFTWWGNCRVHNVHSNRKIDYHGKVYNIEVEGDNSYVVDYGIAVHNCEHVQIPELSKGKILDAVIRPVRYKNAKLGKDAPVYYVDILVATERKHEKLCKKIASGEMSTMSMGCFLAGTPVTMADGTTKPIEGIVVGERVVTHSGSLAEVESTRTLVKKDGETRRLSVNGVPDTFVTEEHPYWTLIGKDKCIGCGDELSRPVASNGLHGFKRDWCSSSCYQTHSNTNPRVEVMDRPRVEQKFKFGWIPAKDLRVGDFVAVPLGRPEVERSSLPMVSCRILGFYMAEGNIQRKPNGNPRAVEFTFGHNESFADEVERHLKAWGVESGRIYRQERERKSGRSTRVVAHSEELAVWLLSAGGEHCSEKRFAEWVLHLDDNSVREIIGAYIDGDGHCRKDGRVSVVSTSKAMMEQVWTMLIGQGIPSTLNGPYENKGKLPAWTVSIKQGKAGRLKESSFKVGAQPDNQSETAEFEGHMLCKVLENEKIRGCYFVYNLHVGSDDHSYFANRLPVHNCVASYVQCSKCGVVLGDNDPNCSHIDNELGREFVDENGVRRMVAELCGRAYKNESGIWVGDPNSLNFIEASWVERPAFEGAIMNHFLSDIPKAAAKILEFPTEKLEQTMDELFRTRVADVRGMMALRVAIEEMNRRRRESMSRRVAKTFWS